MFYHTTELPIKTWLVGIQTMHGVSKPYYARPDQRMMFDVQSMQHKCAWCMKCLYYVKATLKLHFLPLYIEARSVLPQVYYTIGILQQVFPTAVPTGVLPNQYTGQNKVFSRGL